VHAIDCVKLDFAGVREAFKKLIDRRKKPVLLFKGCPTANPFSIVSYTREASGRKQTVVITGFNTDIVHDGVTYHVQTEDKGLDTPLILSLVYTGGAILASKRVPYNDLLDSGFDEKILAERLQRQHKLICAAIRAGRIEDLKLMSQREQSARSAEKTARKEASAPVVSEASTPVVSSEPPTIIAEQPVPVPAVEQSVPASATEPHPFPEPAIPVVPFTPPSPPPPSQPLWDSQTPIMMRPVPVSEFDFPGRADTEEELNLELVEDRDFHAGDVVALRIRVYQGTGNDDNGVANAQVTVKILGTSFRPLICAATTDRDGLAVVFTTLPRFTSGRAAILIRTVVGSQDAEMRRIILPG
jgi:hypothetical protein